MCLLQEALEHAKQFFQCSTHTTGRRFTMNQADRFFNIKNQHGNSPSNTSQAIDQYRVSEYERGIQQIMDQNNVDQRTAENIFSIYARNSLKR